MFTRTCNLLLAALILFVIGYCGCNTAATDAASADSATGSTGAAEQTQQDGSSQAGNLTVGVEAIEPTPINKIEGFDWAQILGPQRNGIATNESLLESWPDAGPQLLWSKNVGEGNAGVVVYQGNVIVCHRVDARLICEALDAATGNVFWRTFIDTPKPAGGMDRDAGPKATPLVHGGKVFLYDHSGWLIGLDVTNGEELWKKDLQQDYGAPAGYFGFGSTPIVLDEKLIVNIGGQQAAVVAFDLDDGQEIWKSFDDRASYSSPTEAVFGGKQVAIVNSRTNVLGIAPEDGTVLFEVPFGRGGATAKGATPVFVNDHLFVNAAYGFGAKWIDLSGDQPTVKWENDSSFSSQYTTPVYLDGYFFGTAGREDFRNGSFRCVQAETGDVKWSENNVDVGHVVLAGNRMILLGYSGRISLIEASTEEYRLLSSIQAFETISRAIPALSNGRLFVRSNAVGGTGTLKCYQVGETR